MNGKEIIERIKKAEKNIDSVFLVGCGASKAELYPAKYFMQTVAKQLHIFHYTANEFVHQTPEKLSKNSIVITCSHGGGTPETVEAAKLASSCGAHVIAVTNDESSALAKSAKEVITYNWLSESYQKCEKMGTVLGLAFEIMHAFENYEYYDQAMDGFDKIYELIKQAVMMSKKNALRFAEEYKDEKLIYVMASGASTEVAYAYAICLLMEMQWINSNGINAGEFFHGPFEITDTDVPFILLMNEGKTRELDSRALDFLNRFGKKFIVIDAKDFGLSSAIDSHVVDFFNPMLLTGVLREYAECLAVAREHPLTQRRYMWKLENY